MKSSLVKPRRGNFRGSRDCNRYFYKYSGTAELFPHLKNLRKENAMNVQTLTFVQVSEKGEQVIALGRRHHWRFRIIPDFQGVIDRPVFSSKGDWLYSPLTD